MNVEFTYSDGKKKQMAKQYADILKKLGKGTYLTRDMRAARPVAPKPVETVADELDGMDIDALRALADERGIKVHHKSGADKFRAALRGE